MSKSERDITKGYTNAEFAAKLRRLADSVESGENFEIQVAGERIYVPDRAILTIEHEREGDAEELEFQLTWNVE
jgi:amphi-Trp domain-containing protein